ncbi:MAG: galactokinase, partial [Chloroflexota bacterium]|nr:galactokinase [Chloroflexota bacterium]
IRIARAPGRVNLIGEHTDYNEGLVMPAAIDLETWIASVPSDDRSVEITLLADGDRQRFELDVRGTARDSWIDYVAGTAWALGERRVPLRGIRGVLKSTLPISAGLSSSAALELASAWSLSADVPPLDRMDVARAAQRGENEYVGVRSGLMDQFASAFGRPDAALLLDCRSLEHRPVPLPLATHALVVCDTCSPRRLEASQYNARRAQCETAVAAIRERHPGVRSLRDVDGMMLQAASTYLDEETLRRCEHVVRENERVIATERALGAGDVATVGRLFAESHASLRDLYEVSSRELDAMVDIALGVDGVVAARMTGAGFGGCTLNLVARGSVDALARAVTDEYPARTGLEGAVYAVDPAEGAGLVAVGTG